MKLCVFSDAHGNLLFLDAFLQYCANLQIERWFYLGDSVGYYPDGDAVLSRLRALGAFCLEGNHDSMLRGEFPIPEQREAIYQLRPTIASVTPENMAFIKSWPEIHDETIDGLRMEFVHGSPLNHLKGYSYEDSDMAQYDRPGLDMLFMGHTHRPWMRQNPHTLLVNVGSVGLPRDQGCRPSFAICDTNAREVQLLRIEVDPTPILANPRGLHEDVLNCLKRNDQ